MNLLRNIVARKQREVAQRKQVRPLDELKRAAAPPRRDFAAALRTPGISAVAEIKRRSPSKGPLRPALDVAAVARGYAQHGAQAVSVLTDQDSFGGSDEDLRLAREAIELPVLRKDFTIDVYQLHEARQGGADAILLIVRILNDDQLREFLRNARELGLAALVEVHDDDELARAVDCQAEIIGVNSRNLDTFEVDLETALRLKRRIPADRLAVAESGIQTPDEVRRLAQAGYDSFLVGETLMRAPDPGRRLAELLGGAS
jgi:indole-3-glycerol phosphate synthase